MYVFNMCVVCVYVTVISSHEESKSFQPNVANFRFDLHRLESVCDNLSACSCRPDVHNQLQCLVHARAEFFR